MSALFKEIVYYGDLLLWRVELLNSNQENLKSKCKIFKNQNILSMIVLELEPKPKVKINKNVSESLVLNFILPTFFGNGVVF